MKKMLPVICLLAAGSAFAQVPMQTTQDYAQGNRLIINGKPLFISGMNIAWHNFARDVGDQAINGTTFTNTYLKPIKEAGGNAVRWWLHTDAQVDPKMNMSTGAVTGIGTNTINNMRTVLDSAYKYGIVVSMCLFSFDLLQNDGNKSQDEMNRNYKFLTEPANLDSYITNALGPILDAIGSHPAIMAWEVFNEPEGMSTEHGWATQKIAHSNIMRFTSKIAGEVHRRTKRWPLQGYMNIALENSADTPKQNLRRLVPIMTDISTFTWCTTIQSTGELMGRRSSIRQAIGTWTNLYLSASSLPEAGAMARVIRQERRTKRP